MSKLQQIAKEHGFIDNDVVEFGELVLSECLKVLDPSDDLTSMHEESGRYAAMRMIERYFGI